MEYIITNQDNELYHYGVRGMKWGVRRATKQLANATTQAERDKAIATLNKHKEKATAKSNKLKSKHGNLQKYVDKHIQKTDIKVSNMQGRAARTRNKAYGMFTSKNRADKLKYKADKLDARANALKARSDKAKAKLAKNENLTRLFDSGISDIDQALVSAGKRYANR